MNLLELRKKAQELGVENYAKYTKEELAEVIKVKETGGDVSPAPEMIVEPGSEEDKALKSGDVIEVDPEKVTEKVTKKKKSPEEKAAEKAAKAEAKEKAKEEKKAEKAKAKAEKKSTEKTLISSGAKLRLKEGVKPHFKTPMGEKVFDALKKGDSLSFNKIAKELGTYYNVVRNIATRYFEVVEENVPEAESTGATENVPEA